MNEARDHSYAVRREIAPGQYATVTERVWRYGEVALIPGDVVQVLDYSNAGFRGIEATVLDAYGRRQYGVSAGILSAS